ncbi:hypothetical protein A8B75_10550 [Sphingomonadales bacterium EhC05]|nr:hypothetical protein A8B75_10550 [Sphingomonadales bacterium EhC05]
MAEFDTGWLYEAGIGENRAMLIESGMVRQIRLERPTGSARPGAIVDALFKDQWIAGKSGIIALPGGEEALLQPLPQGLTEGATIRVELTRAALHEHCGQSKRAKARPAGADSELREGPSLREDIAASGLAWKQVQSHEDDSFAEYGWHDMIEQAESGHIDFDGGSLLISVTPAMTVIDVDGPLAPVELARRAAKEIALTLVRLDIGGNIGVDFPTLQAKAERTAVAAIFDQYMTANCERTAINGFGFMQVIRRKIRPSVVEMVQADKPLSAILQLLRQAERSGGTGELNMIVHPAVAAKCEHQPAWVEELSRRTGRPVSVTPKDIISISAGQIASI